jgi:hypothetical protein
MHFVDGNGIRLLENDYRHSRKNNRSTERYAQNDETDEPKTLATSEDINHSFCAQQRFRRHRLAAMPADDRAKPLLAGLAGATSI